MEFERKVMKASLYIDNGDPVKDVLNDDEIEQAIKRLSDIYVCIFGLPDDVLE